MPAHAAIAHRPLVFSASAYLMRKKLEGLSTISGHCEYLVISSETDSVTSADRRPPLWQMLRDAPLQLLRVGAQAQRVEAVCAGKVSLRQVLGHLCPGVPVHAPSGTQASTLKDGQ